MFKKVLFGLLVALFFVGCEEYYEIPAGRNGKILTPKGFTGEWLKPGQADLQSTNTNGLQNRLVMLEVATFDIKESFGAKGEDGEDHRILTKDKAPSTVDIYIRVKAPDDSKTKDYILEQISPNKVNDRVSDITLKMVYDRFAKMDVRAGTREILSKYKKCDDMLDSLGFANLLVEAMVKKLFEDNGVPLIVQNAKISNIKMDQVIWDAKNKLAAANSEVDKIRSIGAALREYPEYNMWIYKDLGESGKNVSYIIGNVPVAVTPK